jgi:hypothetical protein
MTYSNVSGTFRKAVYAGIGLGLALVLAACGQSAKQSSASGPAASPTTQASIQAADSPTAGTSNDALTGLGATVNVWNAHHTADPKFEPDSAYDPDPTLPSYLGQDVYVAVQWQDGRATNYQMNIPGQPIRAAIERALQELPADARELWGAQLDTDDLTCYQTELISPTLGRVLAAPSIDDPQGAVLAEFQTMFLDGTASYKGTDVNEILLGLGSYPTAASSPGC